MTKNKEEGGYDFDNYKKDSLSRPRDIAWEKKNWFKLLKIGDKVQGYIADVFYRPAKGIYKEQRGITIKTSGGEYINVTIKRLPFVLEKTDNLRIGDPLTVVYDSDLESDKGQPAKVMAFYGKSIIKEGKTVKELDAEDMKAGGTEVLVEEEEDKDFDDIKVDDVPFDIK